MKFLHTADLHIGKVVNDFSMLQDQKFILEQIKEIALAREVDGVLLAGDIYDRAIPSGEAVLLLDEFLTALSNAGIWVFLISGNHDSPERLSFAGQLLAHRKIGIGSIYRESPATFTLEGKEENIEVVLMPYIRPVQADAGTCYEAVEKQLKNYWESNDGKEDEKERNPKSKRRILLTHYFVTDAGKEPELSDSESTVHVGGLDNVEAAVFEGFDYVALGHIHKPQQIGDRPVYYAGSPLKYSFGETNQQKSLRYVEFRGNGELQTETIPLRPFREMRKVEGTLQEIMERAVLEGAEREDYIQAVLTDRNELIDPIGTLRSVYPNIMQIVREKSKEMQVENIGETLIRKKEPLAMFEEFYELVYEEPLREDEREIMQAVIKEASNLSGDGE